MSEERPIAILTTIAKNTRNRTRKQALIRQPTTLKFIPHPSSLIPPPSSLQKSFHGSIQIKPSAAKMHLVQVAEEMISLLASDPNASLNIRLEINAEFPSGVSDQIKRAVSENATALGFKTKVWE